MTGVQFAAKALRAARWVRTASPVALVVALNAGSSLAASIGSSTSWQAGTASWFDGANWTAGVPGSGEDASVSNGGTAQVSSGGTGVADQLTIGSGSAVAVTGGSTLSVAGTGGSGQLTIDGGTLQAAMPGQQVGVGTALAIGSNGALIDSNGALLTISGTIAGSSAGTLTFGGYDGDPNQNFDTVLLGANTLAAHVEILGGTQVVSGSTNGLGTGSVNVDGVFAMGNVNQSVTTLTGGGNIYANGYLGPGHSTDTLTVQSGAFSGLLGDGISNNGSTQYTGTLGLQKTGTGTLVLSNPGSDYSGGTDIENGTIQITNGNALGTGAVTLNGGTLQSGVAAGSSFGLANNIVVGPNGGTIDANGANFLDLTGAISGAGSPGNLTLTSSQFITASNIDLTLSGTNTSTGGLTVAGNLQVVANANNALGQGSLTLSGSGAELGLGGSYSQAVTTLSGNGAIFANGFLSPSGAGVATLSVQSGSFSGVLEDGHSNQGSAQFTGVLDFAKTSTGLLTLSGTSTYSGSTLVDAGTLQAGSTTAFSANSAYTVASGATLDLGGYDTGIASLAGFGTVTNSGSAASTLTVGRGTSNSSTFSGTLTDGTGTLGLLKRGTGTLTLTGTNTFTGLTDVRNGTLSLLDGASVGGAVLVESGSDNLGTLQVLSSTAGRGYALTNTVSGNGIVAVYNTNVTASGNNSGFDGLLRIGGSSANGGSFVVGNATALGSGQASVEVDGGGTLEVAGATVGVAALADGTAAGLGAGAVALGGGQLTVTTGAATADSFAGTIDDGGTPGRIVKGGAGTLLLSGSNTYTGGTLIEAGALAAGNANALGPGAVTLEGGTLASGVAAGTVLNLANAIAVGAGGGTINSNGAGLLTLSGPVSGTSGTLSFTGDNANPAAQMDTLLTGANTFSGAVLIGPGTHVTSGTQNGLGTGSLDIAAGGVFAMGAYGQAVTTLGGAGSITASGYGGSGSSLDTLTVQAGSFAGLLADGHSGSLAGTLQLDKVSPGLLLLSGTSLYSGATLVEAGTLQAGSATALSPLSAITVAPEATLDLGGFGNTAASLSGGGRVTNSGSTAAALTLGGAGNAAFAGVIEDGGAPLGLVKAGAGTETLSGANTYSGATLVAAGTLQAGADGTYSPNSDVMIAAGATLDLAGHSNMLASLAGGGLVTNSGAVAASLDAGRDGASTAFGGTLADGAGVLSLTKSGVGTLALTGANTYSGGTFLDGGALALGDAAALGSGPLTMAPGTTLAALGDLTVPNAIAFAAAGDPTIDTGPNTLVLTGNISGPGDLTKTGTGTLDLAGTSTYTGGTEVAQGTLLVDGSVTASNVAVGNGARLGGRGTIAGLNLLPGATLAPGAAAPFSTLSVTGNAALQPGSTFVVEINPDRQSDRLAVGGTATVAGASVLVNALGSGFLPNTRYTFLTAAGGVTGQFGSVLAGSTDLAFLSPAISYAPGTADLVFTQSAPLASVASTPNQRAAAAAIDSLGPGNRLYDAVIGLDAAGARQAFQATQGETHASATTAAVQSSRVVSSIVFDRLWNLPLPQAGDALDALKQFEPHNVPALLNCYAPATSPSVGPRPGPGYTVWGQAIGDFGHTDSDGNAAAIDRTLGGVVLGIDSHIDAKALQNWRVGVAGGYTDTQFSVKSGAGSGTFENAFGTLYAGARYGNVTLRFGGTYGGTQTNASRTVAFPGFFETERSNNGGDTAQAFGEIGYRVSTATAVVEPVLNGALTHTHQDAYREKGGAAALVGAAEDVDVGSTVLGVRGEVLPFGTLPVVARLFLGWQHAYGDVNPAATLAFASGGATFNSYGAPLDRNAVVAEAGLDWRITAALSAGFTYFGQAGSRNADNAVKGRLEYRF